MDDLLDKSYEMEEDTQKDRYLTFLLGKECYGIDICYVTEIIGIQAITPIPEIPDYVRVIINLRGKIIPVIDVRLRFKKEAREYNDRTCIIVIDIRDISLGLIVDQVAEVLKIPETDTVDPPQMNLETSNHFVRKIGKVGADVKLLLDCEKLLATDDFEDVNELLQ